MIFYNTKLFSSLSLMYKTIINYKPSWLGRQRARVVVSTRSQVRFPPGGKLQPLDRLKFRSRNEMLFRCSPSLRFRDDRTYVVTDPSIKPQPLYQAFFFYLQTRFAFHVHHSAFSLGLFFLPLFFLSCTIEFLM